MGFFLPFFKICKINFYTALQTLFSLHLEKSVVAGGKRAGKLKIHFNFRICFCPLWSRVQVAFPSPDLHSERFLSNTVLALHKSHWRDKYFDVSKWFEVSLFPKDYIRGSQSFWEETLNRYTRKSLNMPVILFPDTHSHLVSTAYWQCACWFESG